MGGRMLRFDPGRGCGHLNRVPVSGEQEDWSKAVLCFTTAVDASSAHLTAEPRADGGGAGRRARPCRLSVL